MYRYLVAGLSLFMNISLQAQPNYPQNYFRNPLQIPMLLAGNFGECRPNHFHSGIDIKTQAKENFVVVAAADGYVSRIKMEPGGFGHALYLAHPNGYTTVYAHLNDFAPAIQKMMEEQQYAQKSWTIDMTLPAGQLPVKKGETIAWSGNTGGSTAPHLHFEIRDSQTENPLNPQLFGFAFPDEVPPKILKLYVYEGHKSVFMQRPQSFTAQLINGVYRPNRDTIKVNGNHCGLGLFLQDYMNNSHNTLAYYTMEWYAHDELQGKITLDDIGYDVTRFIYAYCDHATMQRNAEWAVLLFRQPGNKLKHIYSSMNENLGKIVLNNEAVPVRIVVKDVYGNRSEIQFVLMPGAAKSYTACDEIWTGQNTLFERSNLKAQFKNENFYDSICLSFSQTAQAGAYSSKFSFMNREIPSHFYFDLSLKPNRAIPFAYRSKMAMKYHDGKKESAKAAEFKDGWYTAAQRNFGHFWLVVDSTAPSITPLLKAGGVLKKGSLIKFLVQEKITSVASFEVYAGTQWLCFEQRGNVWQYKIDDHCPKGKITLKAMAKDENNNTKIYTYQFIHQ